MSSGDVNNTGNPPIPPTTVSLTTDVTAGDDTGTVQAPAKKDGKTDVQQAQVDVVQQSQAQILLNNPISSNPKLEQPEVQQSLLSNSDALKILLASNLSNMVFNNPSSQDYKMSNNIYGMDEGMLHRMSTMGFDFSNTKEIEAAFNAKVNDIISASWDKFNEVVAELKKRDQEWLRSGTKYYLDQINSPSYLATQHHNTSPSDEKIKVNAGAGEFEAYLTSLTAAQKDDLLTSVANTGQVSDQASNNLMSSNIQAFGQAFSTASAEEHDHTNTNLGMVLATVMMNAGPIMTHPTYPDTVSTDQMSIKMVQDALPATTAAVSLQVDPNTLIMLGYVAAMFSSSTAVWTSFEGVASAKANGKSANDVTDAEFAKRYATNISKLVNSDAFGAGIMAIITQRYSQSEQPTQDQKSEIVNRIRILMLSNAFFILHTARFGSTTGADWKAAVENPDSLRDPTTGQPKDPVIGDFEYALALFIHTFLPTNPQAKAALLNQLAAYYDTGVRSGELLATNQSIKSSFTEHTDPARTAEING